MKLFTIMIYFLSFTGLFAQQYSYYITSINGNKSNLNAGLVDSVGQIVIPYENVHIIRVASSVYFLEHSHDESLSIGQGFLFSPHLNKKIELKNVDLEFLYQKGLHSKNNTYSFIKIGDSINIYNDKLNHINSYKSDILYEINDNYYLIKNDKYGIIDKNMNQLIPPEYDSIFCYNYKAHIINIISSNRNVNSVDFNFKFSRKNMSLITANQNLIFVMKNGKHGLYDSNGFVIFKPIYDKIYNYYEGFVLLCNENKSGLADVNGNILTPIDYDSFGEMSSNNDIYLNAYHTIFNVNETTHQKFIKQLEKKAGVSNGIIQVKKNGKWGCINFEGKLLLPCIYDAVTNISSGYCGVKKGKQWYIMDLSNGNETLINCDKIEMMYNKSAICSSKKKWFLFNIVTSEKSIEYDLIRPLLTGKLSALTHKKYYIINQDGTINKDSFDEVNDLLQDRLSVRNGNEWQLISAENDTVLYEGTTEIAAFIRNEFLFGFHGSNNSWYDKNGKIIVKLKMENVELAGGLFDSNHVEICTMNQKEKKCGVADLSGKICIPIDYDSIIDNRYLDQLIECIKMIHLSGNNYHIIHDFYNNNYEKLFSY